jgi:glycosyltransferase involved in cell wall biosynthesis
VNTPSDISVIIAAKDEPDTIDMIVQLAHRYSNDVVVVLGTQDVKTFQAISDKKTRIIYCDLLGKGNALISGVASAKNEILVFLDADGSHDPNDIPKLAAPIIDGIADHVSGSRMLGGSSELFYTLPEFIRLIGNHTITLFLNYKYKVRLTDSQNGYRAITKDSFNRISPNSIHSTIEQELTTKSLQLGLRLMELPTHEYARRYGVSKISTWKDGKKHLLLLLKTLFKPSKSAVKLIPNEIQSKYFGPWK